MSSHQPEPDDAMVDGQPADGQSQIMYRLPEATAVLLVLFAVWVGWQALGLRFYTRLGPGPGFFPLILSGLLVVLGIVMLLQAPRVRELQYAELTSVYAGGRQRLAAILLAMGGMLLLLRPLGFRLTMLLFLLFLPPALGYRKKATLVVSAVVLSFGVYHAFRQWLGLPLPSGSLGI